MVRFSRLHHAAHPHPKTTLAQLKPQLAKTLTKGFPNAAVVPAANDAGSTLGGLVGARAGKPRHIVVGA